MNREEAIKELITTINIGRNQNDRYVETLIEIINKTPTEEEIIKEWEALGYKWKRDNSNNINKGKITLTKLVKAQCNFDVEIHIWIHPNKTYYSDCDIDFQEHRLLTKTFKMLKWG